MLRSVLFLTLNIKQLFYIVPNNSLKVSTRLVPYTKPLLKCNTHENKSVRVVRVRVVIKLNFQENGEKLFSIMFIFCRKKQLISPVSYNSV